MLFHVIFLLQVIPCVSPFFVIFDVLAGSALYSFLYDRSAKTEASRRGRPILYVDAQSKELRCPCSVCCNTKPFNLGCAQWFASIDQLYLDCWGIYCTDSLTKKTTTLHERIRSIENESNNGKSLHISSKDGVKRSSLRRRSSLHVIY